MAYKLKGTMAEIEWIAPPKPRSQYKVPSMYDDVAVKLRKNPKRWARIRRGMTYANAGGVATAIRTGAKLGFGPRGSFEAKAVFNEEENAYDLFVRFVGQPRPGRPSKNGPTNPQIPETPGWIEQPPNGPAQEVQ